MFANKSRYRKKLQDLKKQFDEKSEAYELADAVTRNSVQIDISRKLSNSELETLKEIFGENELTWDNIQLGLKVEIAKLTPDVIEKLEQKGRGVRVKSFRI